MTTTYRLADGSGVGVVAVGAGLACCAMEVDAAVRRGLLVPDAPPSAGPVVVLVAGTVTDALAPVVRQLVADLPGPVRVVAFGACASTGGPYWDAPTVTKGVDQVVPVECYVPGCPPRPEDLVAALRGLSTEAR